MVGILKFKGRWRSYQQRILDNLSFHLRDKKLHVVAAPGAGKTTLGLEVIARIGKPTLILTPTNTIKNQWKERLCTAFLEEENYGIISTDIKNPKFITIITYQALLAAFCGGKDSQEEDEYSDLFIEEDIEDKISLSARFNNNKADKIIDILKEFKVSLLCFDEAHHLRKEWWRALMYLNENLEPEQTLALTATPPYDADVKEWQRYEELCGEIDETISIPELVRNGDLCPHQDFVYFSILRESEKALIKKHTESIKNFLQHLNSDNELCKFLIKNRVLANPNNFIEKIYEDSAFYVSIASYLKSRGYKISDKFTKLFDSTEKELPKFNLEQAANFLNGLLFVHKEEFHEIAHKIEEYEKLARHLGLVHQRRIALGDSAKIQKQISGSLGKLDSISEITELESSALGKNLRMVILADFIKAEDSNNASLGVVPIWRTLKDKFKNNEAISIGVLCGSLILIPKSKIDLLISMVSEQGIPKDGFVVSACSEDDDFVRITPKSILKNKIVGFVTEMFNRGILTIITGTQALLGEGWDAPCINSLILSSTVSSYMLSNQMRGRAIRIDKNNPDKISNIWHLATVSINDDLESGLYDIKQLEKRFEGYEAPSYYDNHEIRNGLFCRVLPSTFKMSLKLNKEGLLKTLNSEGTKLSLNRKQTEKWWEDALILGYNAPKMMLRAGVETPEMTAQTLTYVGYKQIILSVIVGFVCPFIYEPRLLQLGFSKIGQTLLLLWFLVLICVLLYYFFKFIKTGSVAGIMKQIAIVMLESLAYQGLIKSSLKHVGLTVNKNIDGIYVYCENLSTEENNVLIKCLQEFLNPVENPRYIFIKQNGFHCFNQTDYFSIPTLLSNNKKTVDIFVKLWRKYIGGECKIIYTRNIEGRKILLKARKEAFSNSQRKKSKRLSKWQ